MNKLQKVGLTLAAIVGLAYAGKEATTTGGRVTNLYRRGMMLTEKDGSGYYCYSSICLQITPTKSRPQWYQIIGSHEELDRLHHIKEGDYVQIWPDFSMMDSALFEWDIVDAWQVRKK